MELVIGIIAGGLISALIAVIVYLRQRKEADCTESTLKEELRVLHNAVHEMDSLKEQNRRLLTGLETVRDSTPEVLDRVETFRTDFDSLNRHLNEVLERLPDDIAAEHVKQLDKNKAELQAQEKAAEYDSRLRPRVIDALELVRAAIAKAASRGLVTVGEFSPTKVPKNLMFSAFQLKGKSRVLEDSGFQITIGDKRTWKVYLELGHTKSPPELADWGEGEGSDHWFPMVRIREDEHTLATVYFDPLTEELSVNGDEQIIDPLKEDYSGEELVAHAVVLLLQRTRTQLETE